MSLHALAHHMATTGRGPDSMLVHMSPREVQGLQALAMAHGGSLTINPQTGLPEAGFLDSLLPALAGFALNAFVPGLGEAVGGMFGLGGAAGTGIAVGGATALASGDLSKGLMAGLGAYGGAGIGGSLASAGDAAMAGPPASAMGVSEGAAVQAASPVGTLDRLQAGMGVAGAAPTDFMKSNMMNLGFAAAPALSGAFDEQTSSAPKIHPGYIRVTKTDPITGRSYQTEAVKADEWGSRPAIEWGGVPQPQGYADGGTTTDEIKKGVPVWGGVGEVERPIQTPEYAMLSDSEKTQRYLMGEGPNPFLFYHKPPAPSSVEKAAEATKTLQEEIKEDLKRGGNGSNASAYGAGLAQLGGSGFTGATTNAYGDSGPTTGLASLANQGAAYLGNMGILSGFDPKTGAEYGLSKAIAKNVDPNYGHESAVGIRNAAANVMANAPNENQAETNRLNALNANAAAAANAAATAKAESDARDARENAAKAALRAAEDAAGSAHTTSTSGGTTSDRTLSEHISGQDSANSRDSVARGGFLNHGRFDQRYADGGATGSGSIDLHVPINLGGGQGGMGGGLGSLGGGFGGGNGIQQRGMSQPSPDFLGQQQQSLPGFQAMQKAQQDYTNSDEYKGFQQYAQQYQQSLGGQSGAFGGGMGGMRGGFGQSNQHSQMPAGYNAMQGGDPRMYSTIENTNQVANGNPRMMMAEGGIAALADGGMYNLGSYSDGGRLLRGPGDGVSDDIPATIGENQPARLADGEFVVPARIVSELGNGSTEAGARKLYAMMDRVQKSRSKTVGKNKIAANSRADKYLPA